MPKLASEMGEGGLNDVFSGWYESQLVQLTSRELFTMPVVPFTVNQFKKLVGKEEPTFATRTHLGAWSDCRVPRDAIAERPTYYVHFTHNDGEILKVPVFASPLWYTDVEFDYVHLDNSTVESEWILETRKKTGGLNLAEANIFKTGSDHHYDMLRSSMGLELFECKKEGGVYELDWNGSTFTMSLVENNIELTWSNFNPSSVRVERTVDVFRTVRGSFSIYDASGTLAPVNYTNCVQGYGVKTLVNKQL